MLCQRAHELWTSNGWRDLPSGGGLKSPDQAAVSGARELILRSSSILWRTYPSSVKCAEAMALRLVATIWSRGRRSGNCGSNSRQNSQSRPERVSKRLTTAWSICFTENGSWGAKTDSPGCGAETHTLPRLFHRLTAAAFVLQRQGMHNCFVAAAEWLLPGGGSKKAQRKKDPRLAFQRQGLISGMIGPRFSGRSSESS
jgi:hypothetical protein